MTPRVVLGSLIALIASLSYAGDADKEKQKELKKLQGSWKCVLAQVDGKTMPKEAFKKYLVVIEGRKIAFQDNGKTFEEAEITIDPSADPKKIDYKYTFGLKKGVQEIGIYQLDGDVLTICMAQRNQKRPTEAVSKKGVGLQLMKLKRASP